MSHDPLQFPLDVVAVLFIASAESALQEVLVHTRHERELAVSHWLLAAAQEVKEARKEWAVAGIALLRCGGIFSAIRVPAEVVQRRRRRRRSCIRSTPICRRR